MSITFQVSPYVASAIVEHAKRRGTAAGYLIGTSSIDSIVISEFVPLTHKDTGAVWGSKSEVREQAHRRFETLKYFNPHGTFVGWYAAGSPEAADTTEKEYTRWCEAPSALFARHEATTAMMLLVHMPMTGNVSVRWEAFMTRNRYIVNRDGKIESVECLRDKQVQVRLESPSHSMNAILADVTSKAFYNGNASYVTSRPNSIDVVAYTAQLRKQDVEQSLKGVQTDLLKAISAAKALLNESNGVVVDKNSVEYEEASEIVDALRTFTEEQEHLDGKDYNEDAFKDALMIKYYTTMLRRQLLELERQAKHDKKEKDEKGEQQTGTTDTATEGDAAGNNNNNTAATEGNAVTATA